MEDDFDEMGAYLTLNKEDFDSVKERSLKEYKEQNPNEDNEEYYFGDAKLLVNDFYLDDKKDTITLNGNLNCFNKQIGWIDLTIPLTQDLVVQIIDRWMKRLGKLKTVLEATK